MIYVTSDLHGRFDCLKRLLDAAKFSDSDWLYIIGDVIDRNGDGGVSILKWMLVQPNVELLLGNPEGFLLANEWLFDEITEDSLDALHPRNLSSLSTWKRNGATPTIEALRQEDPETRADLLDYVKDCPLYDSVSVEGRDFLLVHGGLGNYRPDKKIGEYTESELLWERPILTTRYSDDFTTLIGHTPTHFYGSEYRGRILTTDTWINIDTGAACGMTPCLLRLDDMREFYWNEG